MKLTDKQLEELTELKYSARQVLDFCERTIWYNSGHDNLHLAGTAESLAILVEGLRVNYDKVQDVLPRYDKRLTKGGGE